MRIACLTIKKITYRTCDIYGVSARWSGIQTNSFALLHAMQFAQRNVVEKLSSHGRYRQTYAPGN